MRLAAGGVPVAVKRRAVESIEKVKILAVLFCIFPSVTEITS
jgi:hypothetical protein